MSARRIRTDSQDLLLDAGSGRVDMPSAHYETIAALVRKNDELMLGASGKMKPEQQLLLNLGDALLALSDMLQDEFVYPNTRLTILEEGLSR